MRLIEKHTSLIGFALASLLRRKRKNVLLVLVYTSVIFLLGSVMFFTGSIEREASSVLKEAPEMMVQKLVAGRHEHIPVSHIDAIKRIRGVQSVKPRLWGYYLDPANGAGYTVVVDDSMSGSMGEITVGSGVAKNLAGSENGGFSFKTWDGASLPLKIKSILPSKSGLVSSDLVLISEKDFRRLFSIPEGYATDLVLEIRNAKELTTIATKITQIFPDTRPILRDEILRTYHSVFAWRGGLVIMVLSGAVLAFIILAWDKATGLSAEEKKEMGILKAVGWETSDMLFMKFWEGSAISLSSFLLGALLAYGQFFLSSWILFEPVLKGWAVLYPAFKVTPYIDAYQMATLFFLTVIPYTVATIVPSWRAATIDPDSVMRS
jgi:ABC-type lipoprotein release transport system permease subunit